MSKASRKAKPQPPGKGVEATEEAEEGKGLNVVRVESIDELLQVQEGEMRVLTKGIGYKNWRISVINVAGEIRLRIFTVVNKKIYVKLNISSEDLTPLQTILKRIQEDLELKGVNTNAWSVA